MHVFLSMRLVLAVLVLWPLLVRAQAPSLFGAAPSPLLPKTAYTEVSADDFQGPIAPETSSKYLPTNAVDGSSYSQWHTPWTPTVPPVPHWILLSLDQDYLVDGLYYLPRQGMANGRIADFTIEVSLDKTSWQAVSSGTWPNDTSAQTVRFAPQRARHVRLTATRSHLGLYTSIAELGVYGGTSAPPLIPVAEVRLTWNAPDAIPPQLTLLHYQLYRTTTSGQYTAALQPSTTELTYTDVVPAGRYFWIVKAIYRSTAGEVEVSVPSNEFTRTITFPAPPPGNLQEGMPSPTAP